MRAAVDVLVIGAGPGGIAAAAIAAESGRRVCLLDNSLSLGGQIWRGLRNDSAGHYPHGSSFLHWTERLKASGCEIWQGWEAVASPASGQLRVERDGECCDVTFDRLILATGARERFLPFPGWTLPGVMGAGGAQAMVKSGLDAKGKRVVVSGSGPLLLAVAAGLAQAGAKIQGIFEQAPLSRVAAFGVSTVFMKPGKLVEGARYRLRTRSTAYKMGSWVKRAEGRDCVEGVVVTDGRTIQTVPCDWLACGFGLVPNLELPQLLNCRITAGCVEVDSLQTTSDPRIACVGELTGIGGIEKALIEGEVAGLSAAGRESEARQTARRLRPLKEFSLRMEHAFALRPELRALPDSTTIVCRCEDVAHGALHACASSREAKLHTRCGMGACQGRVCGPATEFLYGWRSTGTRAPVYPAQISTLAAE